VLAASIIRALITHTSIGIDYRGFFFFYLRAKGIRDRKKEFVKICLGLQTKLLTIGYKPNMQLAVRGRREIR
jgi:hypothetical protein